MIRRYMVRHFVLAFIALAAPMASAQGVGTTAVQKRVQRVAPPLGCDRLTIVEGLPNSTVLGIVQDKRGFMWFGTEDGLARYDGIRFHTYKHNPDNPSSIASASITALALDDAGRLWIGTPDNGIDMYDPDTDKFTHFANEVGPTAGISAITRDPKGRMWFALSEGGLVRYEPATNTFTPFNADPLNAVITSLAADKAGNLWLGTATATVIRWNPDSNAAPQKLQPISEDDRETDPPPILAMLVASTGKVWVGTDGDGAFSLDPATGTFTPFRHDPNEAGTLSDDHISVIFEDANKTLWIGTPKGLNRMDAQGRVVRYQHDSADPLSLSFPWVKQIYQDAGGVMWVGGLTVGLCKFNESRQQLGHQNTQGTYATAFWLDDDGTLWVSSYTGGLFKYERKAQRLTVYTALGTEGDPNYVRLDGGWIWKLHRDRKGALWIALKGEGLISFDTKAETHRTYRPDPEDATSLPSDNVFDLHEDEQGVLWLASAAGLVRFDPNTNLFTSPVQEGDASGLTLGIYELYADPVEPRILWVGTAGGGLVRYDVGAGVATPFRSDPKNAETISSNHVTSVYRDKNGIVWVGTYDAGLNRLDPTSGKVERFTTYNSRLTSDRVMAVQPDVDGKLWLATSGGGLLLFDPAAKSFVAFNSSDGAQDEYAQQAHLKAKTGELFFGGANGFNAFMPGVVKRNTYVPPIVMTSFKVGNIEAKLARPIWTLPKIEVSYADTFELQFAALSYSAPKNNRYAYKLEGVDDKFIETDRPVATYRKLDGGTRTLVVRAANEHGQWNEQGIELEITVTPPIWRTWPAYIAYGVVAAGLIFLVLWVQRQRLRRVERESRLAVVEQDLALTGAVQTAFLPENNEINRPDISVFGFYRPADACSGDWWWHERVPDGRHLILVGDVTGHGPGPAMVTAAVATAFRVLVGAGVHDMEQALDLLNREVLRVGKGKYYMTMAGLEIDETTGEWKLYSAGAPPMLGLNQKGKHRVFFCPGTPLGTEEGFETGVVEGVLQPSERLLLYSDGIPEIELDNGNTLGMRRFAQLYESTRQQDLRSAANALINHANQIQHGPQADDWTFTMIGYREQARA